MTFNYETIKATAKELGVKTTDLIALASQNDPFYTGTPSELKAGNWFADLWHKFGYNTAHLRRVHYQIISQKEAVFLPNGKPYENTDKCWAFLCQASKAARYLELVDPAFIIDNRNPDAIEPSTLEYDPPVIGIGESPFNEKIDLPDFPEMPHLYPFNFKGEQRYHLEIWCEKSTMNDVLVPLCETYGATLVTGVGELSITAVLDAVKRIAKSDKPARLFYISDFDPAGRSMPVAVARKLEYFIDAMGLDIDIRLFPIVLTFEQCQTYQLPRTPIKKSEKRAGRFEDRFGAGATELDALEALHPGKLGEIISANILHYYDTTLGKRVQDAFNEAYNELMDLSADITEPYDMEIEALQTEYNALKAEMEGRLQGLQSRIEDLQLAIKVDLHANKPGQSDYPVPVAENGTEAGQGLLNSKRSYLEQIQEYKLWQGKEVGFDLNGQGV